MSQNQTPSKRGLGLGEIWPLLFVVDEAIEAWRDMSKGKDGKAPETSGILWGLAKVVFFLIASPPFVVALIGWGLSHWIGLGPWDGFKLIGVIEVVFIVLLVAWVIKKSNLDPWSRAMKQTRLEYDADPSIKPGDLVTKVRSALGQDSRAADKADDAARKVLTEAQKGRTQSQAPARVLVIRAPNIRIVIGRKTKTDQPLAKAPKSAVQRSGQEGKKPGSGWDIR